MPEVTNSSLSRGSSSGPGGTQRSPELPFQKQRSRQDTEAGDAARTPPRGTPSHAGGHQAAALSAAAQGVQEITSKLDREVVRGAEQWQHDQLLARAPSQTGHPRGSGHLCTAHPRSLDWDLRASLRNGQHHFIPSYSEDSLVEVFPGAACRGKITPTSLLVGWPSVAITFHNHLALRGHTAAPAATYCHLQTVSGTAPQEVVTGKAVAQRGGEPGVRTLPAPRSRAGALQPTPLPLWKLHAQTPHS